MLTKDKVELADRITNILYVSGLALMLIALPIFNLGMSIAGFWLAGVWIVDFVFDCTIRKTPWLKFQIFYKNKAAILLFSIFIMHLLGLFHTSDFQYAFKDLRVKLPLLYLPIVLGTLPTISFEKREKLMSLFLVSLSFSVIVCLSAYFGFFGDSYEDVRSITKTPIVRISHIRLSLMVVLGLFIIWNKFRKWPSLTILWSAIAVLFIYFLWLIQSMTGFIILISVLSVQLLYSIFVSKSQKARVYSTLAISIALLFVGSFLAYCVNDYYNVEEVDFSQLEEFTANGEAYKHTKSNYLIENGHYVWIYIAPKELKASWNNRSSLQYSDKDAKGQTLSGTLIRYLTSKGLRKDAHGVSSLSEQDIKKIERGIPSVIYGQHNGIRSRIDKVLFEIDSYKNGGNPSGNSVTQRFMFWIAGINIIKENTLIGVGTGDIPNAFSQEYSKSSSLLADKYRLRAHNQYISIGVSFGVVGLIWFLFTLIYPILGMKKYKDFLFLSFFSIAILSFLWEDTLETQAGISFFTFFICFFLFSEAQKTLRN